MNNPKSLSYFHSTPIQIRFNDIDLLGHVTNSVYQQYYDLGRLAYFEQVLLEHMNWDKEGLIMASISIDFLLPIRMFDRIEVRSKIYEMGNKSLKMRQEIFNHTANQVASVSKAAMVNFSNSEKRTLRIPEKWRNRVAAFEKDLFFAVKVQ
ncbi:MAG: acyl-CoA thioesterase [Bacteroidales bacterium]